MPRLRYVFVIDYTAAEPDHVKRNVVAKAAAHFQQALFTSGLTGPASTIGVALHPHGDPLADTITVLVQCDRPDGQEIITADIPDGWSSTSPREAARVVSDLLDAGLTRLGAARDWDGGALAIALDSARAAVVEEFGATPPRWKAVAEGRGVSAPEQPHELCVVGGGPTNDVPTAYLDELHRLLDLLAGDAWARWWSASPVRLARIFYWFDAARPGVRVRVGASVTASIERPLGTIDVVDPARQAREDVTSLVQRLAVRLDLPAPPELTA